MFDGDSERVRVGVGAAVREELGAGVGGGQ
jgi:hypothetical protein